MIQQLIWGFFLSTGIAIIALWRQSLSVSGAVGAISVGTLIFGFGGWSWGVMLCLFFISSSLLSHYREHDKQRVAGKFQKGHQRDGWQVLANGGVGAGVAILHFVFPSDLWTACYIGIMATVTADTFATEVGTLAKSPPRLITTGQIVEVGTSGGISWLGTSVSFGGALFMGFAAGLMFHTHLLYTMLLGGVAGLIGSLSDSVLGATVQGINYCNVCSQETERKIHTCGQLSTPRRGWTRVDNDVVNFISSFIGGGIAVTLAYHFSINLEHDP